MDKNLVISILENKPINDVELNIFIVDYIKDSLDKDVKPEELTIINQLIRNGVFNLRYAASLSAHKLGLNVMNVHNKDGFMIKTNVYE